MFCSTIQSISMSSTRRHAGWARLPNVGALKSIGPLSDGLPDRLSMFVLFSTTLEVCDSRSSRTLGWFDAHLRRVNPHLTKRTISCRTNSRASVSVAVLVKPSSMKNACNMTNATSGKLWPFLRSSSIRQQTARNGDEVIPYITVISSKWTISQTESNHRIRWNSWSRLQTLGWRYIFSTYMTIAIL